MRIKKLLVWPFLLVLLEVACSKQIDIKTIQNHPREYIGKEVVVTGEVTDIFSLLFIKYFELKDNTGSIMVITDKPLPAVGEKLKIIAKVQYFSLGDKQVIALQEKE